MLPPSVDLVFLRRAALKPRFGFWLIPSQLRPYVDQSYFGRNHTIPNPYSGFEIFQRHAEMIASKLPDLRSRWQKILDSQPDVEGEGVEQIPVEEEEVLMIGSTDHPVPLEPVDTSIAGTHASSSTLPSSPSMSEPYPPPSTSTSIPSSTSLFEEDEEDDFDDPDRLPRDLQTQPSDLNALPEQTPIYEMTLTQLDSMQRGSAPSDIWTAELEERYQALYREHLLKPPAGSINPLYWDHWKSLSEEQKEAYKFVAKRIWWDVCAQRIREATR